MTCAMNDKETPAERIARKKREAELRKEKAEREAQWRALVAHVHGIMLIMAQLDLGYKPDLRK